jgi:hypothetical protein
VIHDHDGGAGASAMFDIFSVHVVAMLVAGLSLVAVFVYIPFVSNFAFWFMLAAYMMLFHNATAKK